MALSSRMFHGTSTSMAMGVPLVVLNEVGKSGMLKVASIFSNTSTELLEIKLEIDGTIIYHGPAAQMFSTTNYVHGVGVPSPSTSGVAQNGKILNLPFINSIKITVTNNHTTVVNVYWSGDYVLDI